MPTVAELAVRVAVPEPPLIVSGLMLVVRPDVPVTERETVPAKWLIEVIVIVEVPKVPAFVLMFVGLAVIE